jgi:predicted house-cleaning noncanonical NTP pyrophosphatase (MazG superfamily)
MISSFGIKFLRLSKLTVIKLAEELTEYLESGSIEELADIVEVVYALLDYKNISLKQFEKTRIAKTIERGAFKKRLMLK